MDLTDVMLLGCGIDNDALETVILFIEEVQHGKNSGQEDDGHTPKGSLATGVE